MSHETPMMQALDLYELYERDGHLLAVASDVASLPPLRRGDQIVRRHWSTGATPEFIKEQR